MNKPYYFNFNDLFSLEQNLRNFFFKFLLNDTIYFLTFTFPDNNLNDKNMFHTFENYLDKLIILDEKNYHHNVDYFWVYEYGTKNSRLHFHMIANLKSFKGNYFFMSRDWNKFLLTTNINAPSIRINIINESNLTDYIHYILKDYEKGFNVNIGEFYRHYGLSNNLNNHFTSNNSLLEERIKQRFNMIYNTVNIKNIKKDWGFIN